ncbi:2-dehydro-3-deoxy-D-arabinonate dehydratase [Motilibacter peucedani]|uniref:2-dehydro-3-deoxy-D-arabinonate dehydratase n=1 Tax=Motilibacter peucedani TaxID=598650 RepID=A0A420XRE9_9ACTN|nr:fumarylacetoacetate hydrolase family protein [Motilibacter peucedani]RKS77476.1 2-dehydro-3-deoxy-D-arabinonate dehydratase [Motilibacter peucedani]
MSLVRLSSGWAVTSASGTVALGHPLGDLLAMPLSDARSVVSSVSGSGVEGVPLPPVDEQEVWAAGVTYERSREGRREESGAAALYTQVYDAERPELFFKSVPSRVVTDGQPVGIRADSGWDVPEPELGLVVNSSGEIFGYVVGNDMSSRSIEGENPLYLPQAKVYTRSCALSDRIVPVWEAGEGPFAMSVRISREASTLWESAGSTSSLHRTLPDLVDWLFRGLEFPRGVVLLTGTGLVPDRDVTLAAGDVIDIEIEGVGRLSNPVVVVGR